MKKLVKLGVHDDNIIIHFNLECININQPKLLNNFQKIIKFYKKQFTQWKKNFFLLIILMNQLKKIETILFILIIYVMFLFRNGL